MNFPAACLGVHFNVKILLLITFFVNAILCCITPLVINFTYTGTNEVLLQCKEWVGVGNWKALVILRAIQGILQVNT